VVADRRHRDHYRGMSPLGMSRATSAGLCPE
jgi:hypothetical protein